MRLPYWAERLRPTDAVDFVSVPVPNQHRMGGGAPERDDPRRLAWLSRRRQHQIRREIRRKMPAPLSRDLSA
jgi:hypothetical protein